MVQRVLGLRRQNILLEISDHLQMLEENGSQRFISHAQIRGLVQPEGQRRQVALAKADIQFLV